MASQSLINAVCGYENYILANGIDEDVINAMVEAAKTAIISEKDKEYGLEVAKRAKELINQLVTKLTGGSIYDLDSYCNLNKTNYEILDTWYSVLKLEAPYLFDSYLLYLEKNREEKNKFYFPKMEQLNKHGLIQAMQDLEDDKLDYLSISMPPGTQKTTLEKFFSSWIIGKHPSDYSLFFSHSSDITRMFYDGVLDITTSDEYTWSEIFPEVKLRDTNAKAEKMDFGKYKPFYSLQCTSVGSKNSGKVRCNRYLYCDDLIGGIEEAMNRTRLDTLWNLYSVDARQRKLNEQVKEIHIATRWSVHDVIGRLKALYGHSERARFIAIPDIDPVTGESNFNYKYNGMSTRFFEEQALVMDDVSYRCLYKNEPIEREGLLFPEDKIRRYLNLPHGQSDIVTAQCDTKGKGTDYFVMPVFQKYGDDYYCVDCVCDNTADYELQYENASNLIVKNQVQECEFERNAGGDRVAMEVNKRVENKGWICNITDVPTETNKEARIYQCSNWILQHVIFKDKSLYTAKEPYGVMMSLLMQYSVSGKKQLDDVPDVFSNFAIRVTKGARRKPTVIMEGFL
jgi:hypothetical protein